MKKIRKTHILVAALVLALGAAVYLNWQFSGSQPVKSTSKELGAATYVSRSTAATADEPAVTKAAATAADRIVLARTERTQAQDKALSEAKEIISLADNSDEVRAAAVEKASAIERRIIAQNNIESLLMAKGFSDVLCYASDTGCTVTVLAKDMRNDAPLIIKDIVMSQLDVEFSDIVIVQL